MSAGRPRDRVVQQLRVGLRQRRRVLADIAHLRAQRRIAQIGEVDLVDLQVAAAGRREVGDLLAIDAARGRRRSRHVRIGGRVDRLAPAAEMHDGRRRDGDLRRRARDRSEVTEIVDEDRLRPRELAGDLPATAGSARASPSAEWKRTVILDGISCTFAKLQQEVAVPGAAIVLAVGDELEPDVLLHRDHVADRRLLDALELGVGRSPFSASLARLDQRLRPDQAAHMVGAERRLGSLGHAFLLGAVAHSITISNDSTRLGASLSCRVRA